MRLVVPLTLSFVVGLFLSPTLVRAETGVSFYAGKAWTADATVTLEEAGTRLEFDKVSWSDESFTSCCACRARPEELCRSAASLALLKAVLAAAGKPRL